MRSARSAQRALAAEERLIQRAVEAFVREPNASHVDIKTSDVAGNVVELGGPAAAPESHGVVACYRVGARGRLVRLSDVEMQRRWRAVNEEMRAYASAENA